MAEPQQPAGGGAGYNTMRRRGAARPLPPASPTAATAASPSNFSAVNGGNGAAGMGNTRHFFDIPPPSPLAASGGPSSNYQGPTPPSTSTSAAASATAAAAGGDAPGRVSRQASFRAPPRTVRSGTLTGVSTSNSRRPSLRSVLSPTSATTAAGSGGAAGDGAAGGDTAAAAAAATVLGSHAMGTSRRSLNVGVASALKTLTESSAAAAEVSSAPLVGSDAKQIVIPLSEAQVPAKFRPVPEARSSREAFIFLRVEALVLFISFLSAAAMFSSGNYLFVLACIVGAGICVCGYHGAMRGSSATLKVFWIGILFWALGALGAVVYYVFIGDESLALARRRCQDNIYVARFGPECAVNPQRCRGECVHHVETHAVAVTAVFGVMGVAVLVLAALQARAAFGRLIFETSEDDDDEDDDVEFNDDNDDNDGDGNGDDDDDTIGAGGGAGGGGGAYGGRGSRGGATEDSGVVYRGATLTRQLDPFADVSTPPVDIAPAAAGAGAGAGTGAGVF